MTLNVHNMQQLTCDEPVVTQFFYRFSVVPNWTIGQVFLTFLEFLKLTLQPDVLVFS